GRAGGGRRVAAARQPHARRAARAGGEAARARGARGVGRDHARERARDRRDRRRLRVGGRAHPPRAGRRPGARDPAGRCMKEGAARVLAALRQAGAGTCSGAELSAALGVSRAQVWKHVEALRGLGYVIDGEPGGGYRLRAAPDRLYAEEVQARLHTRWLARDYQWLESTDSTNRVAMEWARAGAPHGATVVAEGQSAGRGRLGRRFFSPAGVNLYSSTVLRPEIDTARAPTLI